MTPNEITDLISIELEVKNDFEFKRAMLAKVDAMRATLVRQALERNPGDRRAFTQAITMLMAPHKVPNVPCTESISTSRVPTPLRATGTLFDYIGAIDGSNAFRASEFGTERYMKSKYPMTQYREENGFIITDNPGLAKIRVVGVFENTELAYLLNSQQTSCSNCDYWAEQYPCTLDVINLIIGEITGKWRIKRNNPEIDGKENTTPQG